MNIKIYLDENENSKYKSKIYTDNFIEEILQIFEDKTDTYKKCDDEWCDDEGCILYRKFQNYIKYRNR